MKKSFWKDAHPSNACVVVNNFLPQHPYLRTFSSRLEFLSLLQHLLFYPSASASSSLLYHPSLFSIPGSTPLPSQHLYISISFCIFISALSSLLILHPSILTFTSAFLYPSASLSLLYPLSLFFIPASTPIPPQHLYILLHLYLCSIISPYSPSLQLHLYHLSISISFCILISAVSPSPHTPLRCNFLYYSILIFALSFTRLNGLVLSITFVNLP